MSVIAKYNNKTWTDSDRTVNYVPNEKFYLEIHHNDKKHQQNFVSSNGLGINTSNATVDYWINWEQYQSADEVTKYYLTYPLTISADGEYWVEVLYHHKTEGFFPVIFRMDGLGEDIILQGSDNFMNRYTKSYNLQKGEHTFKLTVDPHICILGVVVKKIDTYGADESLSKQNTLTVTSVNHTVSETTKADELSFELLYDNEWKDPTSMTDYLFDYHDEVNFSVENINGEFEQIFGGYITACTLNSDETILTVKCAGRLLDGEKRYIVEEINVGGDAKVLTDEHLAEDIQRFNNYNDTLNYIFRNFETQLKSNMTEVFTEEQYDSVEIDLTEKVNVDNCQVSNVHYELKDEGLYLRNATGTNVHEYIKVYDSAWFSSEPVLLDDYPIFFMTYGMGEPMVTTETGSGGDGTEGVSSDGSVITVKMKPSCGCCAGTAYQWYTKSWKNYCPNCKKSGTLHDTPKGRGNVPEGEITCGDGKAPWTDGCDSDFCGVCGGDKAGAGKCRSVKLIPASASESSNTGNVSKSDEKKINKSLDNLFQTITDEAFRYQYKLRNGTCSDFACMQRSGYGDCWAFSDLIYTRLKQAGVGAKIVNYATSGSSNHRSVLYKTTTGEWEDFPYRKYGWGTRFNNALNNTGASKSGKVVASTDGIGIAEGSGTVSNGFDKDKQFMCWIKVEYTVDKEDVNRKAFYIDFTGHQSDIEQTYRGFAPISLNNIFTTGSTKVVNKVLTQYDNPHVYLRSISLEYVVQDEVLWENTDSSTDNASYRMILKKIGFRNGEELNPTDLGSTGKSLNELLNTVIENSNLRLRFYPAQYRRDDRMVVSKNVETDPRFTVLDGNGGNLLDISNWNFTPASDYINRSLVVYKSLNLGDENSIYHYLASRKPEEILCYGEVSDLVSISDDISSQEAYYESVKNPNYTGGDRVGASMTVTVVGVPSDLQVGDFVEVVLEDGHYTDWKEVKSITHSYDVDNAPKLQTKLGLNKPEKSLELKDEFEAQRKLTKSKKAVFGKTATYDNSEIFKWED